VSMEMPTSARRGTSSGTRRVGIGAPEMVGYTHPREKSPLGAQGYVGLIARESWPR